MFILAVFEPIIAPKLTFLFPLLCSDADYQLTFKENKARAFIFYQHFFSDRVYNVLSFNSHSEVSANWH